MKHRGFHRSWPRGASLIEVIIATGVLAVVLPMVGGALAEAGKSGIASQAETRSTWMIPACMEEIRASREGCSQFFSTTTAGETFPPDGEVWALAFSPEGKVLGKVSKELHATGTRTVNGMISRYIVTLKSSTTPATPGTIPMIRVHLSLEYPAASPVDKRQKLDFHTRIP